MRFKRFTNKMKNLYFFSHLSISAVVVRVVGGILSTMKLLQTWHVDYLIIMWPWLLLIKRTLHTTGEEQSTFITAERRHTRLQSISLNSKSTFGLKHLGGAKGLLYHSSLHFVLSSSALRCMFLAYSCYIYPPTSCSVSEKHQFKRISLWQIDFLFR